MPLKIGWIHLCGMFAASSLQAAEVRVSSAAEIAAVTGQIKPGDTLLMVGSNWQDQSIIFRGQGTLEKPILLRAEKPGKLVLTGKSSLLIQGDYLVVSGLILKDGKATGDGVKITGRYCRLTDTSVVGGAYKFLVHIYGLENRLDHCYLAGKTNDSPTLQIEVEDSPNHHRIDHNHFGPRPPLGRNGGETIRVGYSGQSMRNSATVVEYNLFERCDGELEIISNKSCENTYRGNTFLDCAGTLTLRHGNRCRVEGNFFLGHHKKGAGGIRIIGEDHIVINNYMDGLEKGGFWVTAGIPNSPLNGYFQARNCLIAFNTFVDSCGPAIELDAGMGSSGRTLWPENITIANNLFSLSQGALLKGKEGKGFKWLGNMAAAPEALEHQGIKFVDSKLARAKDGQWRPAAESPARGAAQGECPAIKTDSDGQERTGRWDVGCDQLSEAPVTNRPLTPADVGPSWMERTAR